jgi:outer membrane protein OmpA-like peptidoglycan-associated protein
MTMSKGYWASMGILAVVLAAPGHAQGAQDLVPARGGVTIVVAVNTPPGTAAKGAGILEGDYEMVITLDSLDSRGLALTAHYDGKDETGTWRRGQVKRLILPSDLDNGAIQIHGWHSSDGLIIPGTTSLGPSKKFVRALVDTGRAEYRFRGFAFNDVGSGILTKTGVVKFPVLINGRRVDLPAVRAQGQMTLGGASAPFELVVLDHPRHPLALRIANGGRGEGFPFKPRFAREIVRIDYADEGMRETLERECRVEVPGIYFDFNRDTLKPQSAPALTQIAHTLREMKGRRMVIEGHTDNVGGDAYNDDLSARRAHAVRAALLTEHGVAADQLTTRGFGERKPVESNDTIAGRARNRRVELACAGS